MSSNNTSGVRNLRVMFENKASADQSTSPPSRGRSPLGTESSENARPLSKVRASFIAVEKPGQPGQAPQWGLRKASDVSSVSGVNGNITEESSLRRITSRNSIMADRAAREDLGFILKGSPFEGEGAAHTVQAEDLDQAVFSAKTQKNVPEIDTKRNAPSQEKAAPAAFKMKSPTSTTKPKSSSETSKIASVKGPPTKQIAPKPAEKSPLGPQSPQSAKVNTTHPAASVKGIRGGPAKIMAVMESASKARVEREKKSPVEAKHSQPKKDPPKAPITNNMKKDPTSSLSTDSRQFPSVRKDKPPPKATSASTAPTLAKRTPRNSLAPQTNGHERPKSRVSTAKDESFLARMTRPTASSQQKVHEKVVKVESPPRVKKVSDRVRQSLGPAKKHDDQEDEEGVTLEATKSIPEVEEQKTEMPGETAVAQEAT